MQRFRMREPGGLEPEFLVVADRVDDKRVAVPASDRRAVVARDDIRRLREGPAVRGDDAPVAVAVAVEDEDTRPQIDELKSLRSEELPRSAGRHAPAEGIVLEP